MSGEVSAATEKRAAERGDEKKLKMLARFTKSAGLAENSLGGVVMAADACWPAAVATPSSPPKTSCTVFRSVVCNALFNLSTSIRRVPSSGGGVAGVLPGLNSV